MPRTFLVTGAAGFIGSHLAEALLARGDRVVGLDNLDDYYDPAIKRRTLSEVSAAGGERFTFAQLDVRDGAALGPLFKAHRFDGIAHLAALAGVRASAEQASRYYDVNLQGTIALLDCVRTHGNPNFVFASTSSAYGSTGRVPFVEDDACDRPLAPYPASKRSAELLGHAYHHLFGVNFTALRFFTVYGPRNRPDMMAAMLLESIFEGRQLKIYEQGQMLRDWTFVGDIVAGVVAALDRPLGYEVVNIGRGQPVMLADFVRTLEQVAGGKAQLTDAPMPAADVRTTFANIDKARRLLGYTPATSVEEGVRALCDWYRGTR